MFQLFLAGHQACDQRPGALDALTTERFSETSSARSRQNLSTCYTMGLYSLQAYLIYRFFIIEGTRNLKGVEVIQDTKRAKVLVDPMRREMLRLLSHHDMTENQLADSLGLSNPAIGHHLKILKRAGLIRIARRRIEKHGIVQKFYETNALFYIVNSQQMPLEIERYLMPISLERVRGMVAAASTMAHERITISTIEVETFAKTMNSAILQVAPRYSARSNLDREELIGLIYQEALSALLKKRNLIPEKVQSLFERFKRADVSGHL